MNPKEITIAAAIILNAQNQTLLVRKKNTDFFMHVGGKLETNESAAEALTREAFEEIGCDLEMISYIGQFETRAANEKDCVLISYLFYARLNTAPKIQAELAEMKWVDLDDQSILLAPLTQEISMPWCKAWIKNEID